MRICHILGDKGKGIFEFLPLFPDKLLNRFEITFNPADSQTYHFPFVIETRFGTMTV